MGVAIPAEVFRDGDGQAVRIPVGLELPAGRLVIRQDGPRLVIESSRTPLKAAHPSNQLLIDALFSLDPIDEEFEPIADPPPRPVEF